MAGIRKRVWETNGVKKFCYEITYYFNGKQLRKSGFRTRQEAQDKLQEVTASYNSNITFELLAQDYINRHCKIHCKESSIELYKSYLKVNLSRFYGQRVKDITLRDISGFIVDLKESGLSNKHVNNIFHFLKAIFNYGVENEYFSKNPCSKIKKLQTTKKQINFLSEEQVQMFLKVAQKLTLEHYALFYTAINTGMRRGELLGLEWNDINFVKKTISIDKQWYKNKVTSTKTAGSTRVIKISDSTCEVLKEHKRINFFKSKIVFADKLGKHQHAWNMTERYFKKVLKFMQYLDNIETSNLDSLRFHDLRHTYASLMLSKGAPIKFVQEQLGHTTCKMTLDTYNHIMPKESEIARNLLDNLECEHNMSIDFLNMAQMQ